jgi:hypothetical protein
MPIPSRWLMSTESTMSTGNPAEAKAETTAAS